MTQQQIIEQIKQLSIADRASLLEEISRSIREEIEANGAAATGEPADDAERERRAAAIRGLRGIAKPDGPPPSDEEIKEDYTRYLTEKYS